MKILAWIVALLIVGPLGWAMFGAVREAVIKGWQAGLADDPGAENFPDPTATDIASPTKSDNVSSLP